MLLGTLVSIGFFRIFLWKNNMFWLLDEFLKVLPSWNYPWIFKNSLVNTNPEKMYPSQNQSFAPLRCEKCSINLKPRIFSNPVDFKKERLFPMFSSRLKTVALTALRLIWCLYTEVWANLRFPPALSQTDIAKWATSKLVTNPMSPRL